MNENKNKGCGGCHDKEDDDGCCGGCHDDKDQDQADKNTQKPADAGGSKKKG